MEKEIHHWKTANNIFEKEKIQQKTLDTQAGIVRRGREREIKRKERMKQLANRLSSK